MNPTNFTVLKGRLRADAERVPVASKLPKDQQAAFDLIWEQKTTVGTADHVFTCVIVGESDVAEALPKLKQYTPVLVTGELRARDGAAMKIRVSSWEVGE